MNIISGKYGGRRLYTVNSKATRPTLARVKESLFCMIDEYILGATVLDLFAGSGALGIECISRGAGRVYFCDKSKDAVNVIRKNLHNINENFEVLNCDYLVALKKLEKNKFNLVFLDPAYASESGIIALKFLVENDMLLFGAIIVFEHPYKKSLQTVLEKCIMIEQKIYGDKAISIFKYEG